MLRLSNVRRRDTPETIEKRFFHLLEEVNEVADYIKDDADLLKIVWVDEDGVQKPEGFAIEVADVIFDCLRLLEDTGHDPDSVIEMKLTYHEQRRLTKKTVRKNKIKKWTPKTAKAGKKEK